MAAASCSARMPPDASEDLVRGRVRVRVRVRARGRVRAGVGVRVRVKVRRVGQRCPNYLLRMTCYSTYTDY